MKRLLVPALGVAALAFSTPAGAQSLAIGDAARVAYVDDARQPYYEARRAAYDNGYREGVRQGERDGRNRRSLNYQTDRTYQRADKGYSRSFGDLERYRQQFRAGFAEGYQYSYSRYGPSGYGAVYDQGRAVPRAPYGTPGGYYPNQNRYPDPYYGTSAPYGGGGYTYNAAYPNGVNDGIEKGREDARKHRSFDPLRHSWYRSGDRHYRNEYGPKQQYQNAYRQGFQEGYDRGYREIGGGYRW